jgi:hypothetical protein
MNRIGCLLPCGEMALRVSAIGGGNLQIVVVVDVAGSAGHVGVSVRQQKSGRAVVECGAQPAVKFVAALAVAGGERRASAGVHWIGGVLPILQVAGIASSAQAEEYPRCGLLVALIALHRGVSSQQRKPVLMIAHLLHGDVPALHSVALRAVRAHLAAVDVRMAIGAVLSNIGEYRLYVTLRALHFFVHSAERIFRLVVIEFGNCADRAPARRRMAVFAGDVQWPMGIPLGFLLSRARSRPRRSSTVRCGGSSGGAWKRQQSPERELEQRERIVLPPRDTNTCRGGTVEILGCILEGLPVCYYCTAVQL